MSAALTKRKGTGALDALGFGLVGALRSRGTGLDEEKARLEAEVKRLETGKSSGERAGEGFRAAAQALGIKIQVDQDGRVRGATLAKATPGVDAEVETDLGVQ